MAIHPTPAPTETYFNDQLAHILEKKQISPREFADRLNLDLSLVYKWLRGERTPRFNTGHTDRIADALDLTTRERRQLVESQVASLRARSTARQPLPTRRRAIESPLEKLLGSSGAPNSELTLPIPRERPADDLLRRGGAVLGDQQQALALAVRALETAPPPPSEESEILLTWQGEGAFDPFDPPFGLAWQRALRHALAQGWKAKHIWRLTRDVNRSVDLVNSMLDLLAAGRYEPLYVGKHEALAAPYEMLIIPGHVALLFFATQTASVVDSVMVTHDCQQINLLRAHHQRLSEVGEKLLEGYPRRLVGLFDRILVEAERRYPGRNFVKYSPSVYTEPPSWSEPNSQWARRMREMGIPAAAVERMCEHRTQRLVAFFENEPTTPYRDICTMRAIADITQRGWYLRNRTMTPTEIATPAERREHLQNAIAVLKTRKNYSLALADEREEQTLHIRRETMWSVLAGKRALINVQRFDSEGQTVDLDITIAEPMIVTAFERHFETLWAGIAPEHRDRDFVIGWLEEQLKNIPDE